MSKENPPLLTAEMARAYLEFWSGTGPDPDDDRGADETLYEALRALASGKTECRPAGAVPAGERERFEAWLRKELDLRTDVGLSLGANGYTSIRTALAWAAWQAALTSAAPPPSGSSVTAVAVLDGQPTVTRSDGPHTVGYDHTAPPPVVPQVDELLLLLTELDSAVNGVMNPQYSTALSKLRRAIAALGAAPTDLQAVGCAQGQHDATTRASRSTEVPSTEEKP